MTIKSGHHYFDKDQNMNFFIKNTSKGIFFSIQSNQTQTSLFTHDCTVEQLKGLADFIYNTIEK
jgi:hypothetical protein